MPIIAFAESVAPTIDTTSLVSGLTQGANGMVTNFTDMLGNVLPVALPVIGLVAGISFVIGMVRHALH